MANSTAWVKVTIEGRVGATAGIAAALLGPEYTRR